MFSIRSICLSIILGATVLRLFLLGGPPDIPDWRQADTGYMALRMMEEWPPEMLHPKAPYRGTNDVKAAEFPIYPLVVSLVYRVAGHESLPAARVVTLLFFLGSMIYLGRAVGLLFGSQVGWLAATVYMVLPIGIPYSRMIHPDFCVMFFANGFFYHMVTWFARRRRGSLALATITCSALFLMKAPYGVYYGFPLGLIALDWDLKRSARDLAILAAVLVIPLALGIWFNDYRIRQEAPHEESLVYPMKWTKESLNERFFGTMDQRLDAESWAWMIKSGVIQVATPLGAALALLGLFLAGDGWRDKRRWLLWFLAGGMFSYILLLFPMVSGNHDYYSIPFMVLVAVASACALNRFASRPRMKWLVPAALVLVAIGSVYGIQRGPFLYHGRYFDRDWQRIKAAQVIRETTHEDDVVISVTVGRSTMWSDPRILWLANRVGWSIEGENLTPKNLKAFREAGATVAGVLMTPQRGPLAGEVPALDGYPAREIALNDPEGKPIGSVVMVRLKTEDHRPKTKD